MNKTPIHITEKAAQQINALIKKADNDILGVRLNIKATGCSGNSYKMEYVEPKDDISTDEKFEENGAEIYIPKLYSWMLFGTTIDYITDELGNARFDFQNPNEIGRCGCGESFQVGGTLPNKK
ncbi:MAG: iron-sulfur cluster assembly accessory protein [Alphaproteobacteria bacterium]|nr:iron-sulfur cluster assembly accessory protein [Alphaproteobacteria bacterium]